jgi:putative MATE family efflux protein
MKYANRAVLIEGPIGKILFKLTVPMIFGILGMVAFNLVDTFFVGQLGAIELAALSFTFPVVLVVSSLAMGLGMGVAAVVSRAIGEGDSRKVRELTTDSLILALLVVSVFIVLGLLTLEPIFRLIGANSETLPLIKQYMKIWYPGMIFVVIPMVGNNAIRGIGDTKTPSAIMLVAVIINCILDPLLIFGVGPFPRLELAGAAIATVIARASTLMVSLFVLIHRERMLMFTRRALRSVQRSWKSVLFIGLPAAGTRIVIPLVIGVITRLVSSYGPEAVAGFGVASRIEIFALAVIWALASVIGPFAGQNWGAGKLDRIKTGIKKCERFSLAWGFGMFAFLAIAAEPIASVFNDNPIVIKTIVMYIRIVPFTFGLEGILILMAAALYVLHKPYHATALVVFQMVVLYIPLAHMGSILIGLPGIFVATAVAYGSSGILAHFLTKSVLDSLEAKEPSI